MWDWRRVIAFASLFGLAGPIYFFVFWRWFDFWRTRRRLWFAMFGLVFAAVFGAGFLVRDLVWRGHIAFPAAVQAFGWTVFGAATVLGTVADRQIGVRVRSFRPFFERHGHIDLKTTGAFGVVRHPIYTSAIGCLVGFFLVTGYPAVMLMAGVFALAATWFTRQEEERLIGLLDDPDAYVRYRQHVPALVPGFRRPARSRWPRV